MTEQEQTPAESAAPEPAPALKPMVVNLDRLTWGDIEFFEDLQLRLAGGERPRFADLVKLVTLFFEDWTEADARAVRLTQTAEIVAAIAGARTGAINPTTGSS